ncbi:hypothetical protein COCON_G00073580 [Conger conger]|uniref:MIF4G domain-containing protein n=1 Tax=Conger conger TaxID=82655 RepID=A0A9Q1DN64_CONCO|nr:hypothetical protein COCON_G00073580 [Conger conger]
MQYIVNNHIRGHASVRHRGSSLLSALQDLPSAPWLSRSKVQKQLQVISVLQWVMCLFMLDVNLHKAEAAWKPVVKKTGGKQAPEETVTEELFSPMLSILNKLAIEKFERLMNQNNWVPRRGEQGPETISLVHKDAEMESQLEIMKAEHSKMEESRNTIPVSSEYAITNTNQPCDICPNDLPGVEENSGQDIVSANCSSMDTSQCCEIPMVQNAWRPSFKKDRAEHDPEMTVTQELFRHMRSILNKLTPEKFDQLVSQVPRLQMDTTERLQGVVDIIFEKAIFEPKFSSTYAKMCQYLMELNAPINDSPKVTLNFRLAILNCCWVEFNLANEHPKEELEANSTARRQRALGNIKFLGELFKLDIAEELSMHRSIGTLLNSQGEGALECLCCLLSTIGSKLDCGQAKYHMDKYFHQIEQILKNGKKTSRIRFMLQDITDLRQVLSHPP